MTQFKPNKSVSFAENLFLGSIVEDNLLPYPGISSEESETLSMVLESITRFMQGRDQEYREMDKLGAQPEQYIQSLREMGLFGLIIPQEYGGFGLSSAAYSRVLQQTSYFDGSTSLTIGAHSSIGMKGLLLFGSEDQRSRYLPRLASGEMIAAFCLTEAGSGSDAGSIRTSAIKQPDGTWLLNGEKIWISNGAFADFFTVLARTDSAEGKISAFLVERGFGGVTSGPKEDKMGIRASATTTVRFENVRIPAENLLGEEGRGFKVAMNILNNGRTGLGGGCVGAMKRCIALASEHAEQRKQFGRRIAEFELVKEKISQMTINCFAAESAVNLLAHYIDAEIKDFSVEAAICKVFATEALWNTAYDALQVAGGNGFMREFPYERIVRDARINTIYEGTNEILRLYIALTGMKDAGEYLKGVLSSTGKIFNDPIKGFGVLSGYASRKIAQITNVGGPRLSRLNSSLKAEGRVYDIYVLRLSKAVEAILRRLGKNVIGSQFITKRVADVAIDLFVGMAVLARVSSHADKLGADSCKHELEIARMFTQQAKRRMNHNLRRLESNEDPETRSIADKIVSEGRYIWDVL